VPAFSDEFDYDPTPRYGHGRPPHARLHALLEGQRARFLARLQSFLPLLDDLSAVPVQPTPGSALPPWINGYLPGLDLVAVYGFAATLRPALILEIGSGVSTRVFHHAISRRTPNTRLVSIDPEPRDEVDRICDEVFRQRLETAPAYIFEHLRAGDILFFDGSHRALMNSDVTVFFLEVLPALPAGVFVQIHDIWLPSDYGPEHAGRYYSEQYLLAVHLLARGEACAVELPAWFISGDPGLSAVLAPFWAQPRMAGVATHGCSFWFRTP
jgi:hypothetical protein